MRKVLFAVCMLFCGIVTSVAQDGSYRLEGRLEPTVNGQMVLIADTENGLIELGILRSRMVGLSFREECRK